MRTQVRPTVAQLRWSWHAVGALGTVTSQILLILAALSSGPGLRVVGWTWCAGTLATTGALYAVLRRRPSAWWLMVWPALFFLRLAVLEVADHRAAQLILGLITICFVFSGLTQPPGRSLWMLIPALIILRSLTDFPLSQAAVRLFLAAICWSMASELPAHLMRKIQRQQVVLASLADTDALTGVRNRHGLPAVLTAHLGRASVVILDLDHFKNHNDSHGHLAGDQILIQFAAMLQQNSRSTDQLVRYGGEEFLVVMPDTDVASAAVLVARWRYIWDAAQPELTFSAGITDLKDTQSLRVADEYLYAAKAAGRNRTVTALGETSVSHTNQPADLPT